MQVTVAIVTLLFQLINLQYQQVDQFCLQRWRNPSPTRFHVMDGRLQATRATRASTRDRATSLAARSRASAARVGRAPPRCRSRRTLHRHCPLTDDRAASCAGPRSHSSAPTTAGHVLTCPPRTWSTPLTSLVTGHAFQVSNQIFTQSTRLTLPLY